MSIDPTSTHSNFISNYRKAVNDLLDARETLKGMRELAITQNYPTSFVSGAFQGNNMDLSGADITNVFTAMDALEQVLTNFATTPPTPTVSAISLLKLRQ